MRPGERKDEVSAGTTGEAEADADADADAPMQRVPGRKRAVFTLQHGRHLHLPWLGEEQRCEERGSASWVVAAAAPSSGHLRPGEGIEGAAGGLQGARAAHGREGGSWGECKCEDVVRRVG